MALRIPDAHKTSVDKLAAMSDEVFDQLYRALESAKPAISHRALSEQITAQIDMPLADLAGVLLVLLSLVLTRENTRRSVEQVASEIAADAEKQEIAGESSERLRQILKRFLTLPTLEITARAGRVYFAHDQLYQSSRVLSDVRTLFSAEDPSKPVAGLIVHNLELSVMSSSKEGSKHYVALNSHDLRELQRVVERALAKDVALARIVKETGMTHIEDVPNEHQK